MAKKSKEYMEAHTGELWGGDGRKAGLVFWPSDDDVGSEGRPLNSGPPMEQERTDKIWTNVRSQDRESKAIKNNYRSLTTKRS